MACTSFVGLRGRSHRPLVRSSLVRELFTFAEPLAIPCPLTRSGIHECRSRVRTDSEPRPVHGNGLPCIDKPEHLERKDGIKPSLFTVAPQPTDQLAAIAASAVDRSVHSRLRCGCRIRNWSGSGSRNWCGREERADESDDSGERHGDSLSSGSRIWFFPTFGK